MEKEGARMFLEFLPGTPKKPGKMGVKRQEGGKVDRR